MSQLNKLAAATVSLNIRHAGLADVPEIHRIISQYAQDHLLLPRTVEDLTMRIGNFYIAEINEHFVGCTALRDYGNDLYEVRSLAIDKTFCGQRIGSRLVSGILEQLRQGKPGARVFALTYRSAFFCRLGFQIVNKDLFPEKIWSDCSICPKKNCCDEIAVMIQLN